MKKRPIIFIFCIFYISIHANNGIDFKQQIKNRLPDSVKINALIDLCWKYSTTDPQLAISYGNKALYLSIKTNDQKRSAEAYSAIGVLQYYQSNYAEAMQYFKKSLHIRQKLHDKPAIASALSNIGLIYDVKGDYGQALLYHLKALTLWEEANDKTGIAKAYNNIGLIYFRQDKSYHEIALGYFEKALKIKESMGDKLGIVSSLNTIGMVYYESAKTEKNQYQREKLFEKALESFDRALFIGVEIDDKRGIATILLNIGNIYGERADYEKALANYTRSLSIHKEYGNKSGEIQVLYNIGFVKAKQNKAAEAINNYEQALKYALEIDDKEWILQIYKDLANVLIVIGNHKDANECLLNYSTIKDTIFSLKSSNQIAEMQAKYDIDKKEKQILLLEKDKQMAEYKLSRNYLLLFALLLLLLLVVSIFLYVYRFYKLKNKDKEIEELLKTKREKNILIKEIHHRVKNNIQIIISLLNLQMERISDDESLRALTQMKDRLSNIACVHHVLYQNKNLISIDLYILVDSIIEKLKDANKQTNLSVDIVNNIDKSINLSINDALPFGMALYEIVSNSVLHAFNDVGSQNKPQITINAECKKSRCFISIADNGKGFDELIHSRSLGLHLINSVVKDQLGADLRISTKHGTRYDIEWNMQEGKMID